MGVPLGPKIGSLTMTPLNVSVFPLASSPILTHSYSYTIVAATKRFKVHYDNKLLKRIRHLLRMLLVVYTSKSIMLFGGNKDHQFVSSSVFKDFAVDALTTSAGSLF